ncbi:aladin-like [Clavelina lepadiformis]|uniref:aladin-like n=1 Tax=Clavelina lepadiformis TaxID=159417 RepID=UPI0040434BA8
MSHLHNQTICEVNGELVNETSFGGEYLVNEIASYPRIHVTAESLRKSAVTHESAQSAFLEHSETLMQRVQAAWYSHGIIGALTEICDNESDEQVSPYIKHSCHVLLVSLRWLSGMQLTLFPHLKLSNDELIASFSENSNWQESPIRYLCWHSHADKFAIALKDDTIRIHYNDNELVPMLKHKLQRNVTMMSWKPLSASTLAVGTQTAVLVWNIDPTSLSTRPSSGAVQVLSHAGHSPVTSIGWNPRGLDLLFTTSTLSSAIVVWNVSMKQSQVIQHVTACGGISRLLFSPDGNKVITTTPSSSFRVFETATWTNERWSKLAGRVQSSCWNPSGTLLLFALYRDPRIYSLTFSDSSSFDQPVLDGPKHASVILDLTPDDEREHESSNVISPSNIIHSICVDPTGERLAVMFGRDDPRCHLVAVYALASDPVVSVTPSGFIHGPVEAIPTFITFKPNVKKGALLTICYSNGHVGYIPMYFKAANQLNRSKILTPLKSFSMKDIDQNQSMWSKSQNNSLLVS